MASKYEPFRYKRTLNLLFKTPDKVWVFHIESFTSEGKYYHPSVDCVNGNISCDCIHFLTRIEPRVKQNEHLFLAKEEQFLCKHLKYAVWYLAEIGEL